MWYSPYKERSDFMEERNQILREKLTMMHTWTIAAAACIVLVFNYVGRKLFIFKS
jgi:hypothetical protein